MTFTRRSLLTMMAGAASLGTVLPLRAQTAASTPQGSAAPASSDRQRPLKIGVIGAGWLGGTVGSIWVKAGHEVMFSARNLDRVRRDVQDLGNRASVGTPREAAAYGQVLLFAVPFDAMPQLGRDLASELRGKIVLDASNGSPDDPIVQREGDGNVGLAISKLLAGSLYARAFSCVDATQIEASWERKGRAAGRAHCQRPRPGPCDGGPAGARCALRARSGGWHGRIGEIPAR